MNYQEQMEHQRMDDRAVQAAHRRMMMKSMGHNAVGILANTKHGPMVVDAEDGVVGYLLLNNGSYGEEEFERAKCFVNKDSNVLVVGANIGAHVVPLSRECKKLVAIEANPNTFKHLVSNIKLNSCFNVELHHVAASDKEERIKFLMNRENGGGSKRAPVNPKYDYLYDRPYEIEVEARALDEIVKDRNFDYILMDIEGSEYFALKGMQDILKTTKAIAVEFYPFHIKDIAGVTIAAFLSVVEPHFEWLFIPDDGLYDKANIVGKLTAMFDAGEIHEGIIFLKDVPEFLKQAQPTA